MVRNNKYTEKYQNERIEKLRKEGKLYEYPLSESVLFNSYYSDYRVLFSNMYPCPINHKCKDGVTRTFNGIDHLYHFILFEDIPSIREQILSQTGVCACFRSQKIRKDNSDKVPKEYHDVRTNWNILYMCHREKARDCKEFREALLSTKGKYLVEDSFWDSSLEAGCCIRENKCYGENYCGRSLMVVRDRLLKELEAKEVSNSKEQKITFKEEVKETISAE